MGEREGEREGEGGREGKGRRGGHGCAIIHCPIYIQHNYTHLTILINQVATATTRIYVYQSNSYSVNELSDWYLYWQLHHISSHVITSPCMAICYPILYFTQSES